MAVASCWHAPRGRRRDDAAWRRRNRPRPRRRRLCLRAASRSVRCRRRGRAPGGRQRPATARAWPAVRPASAGCERPADTSAPSVRTRPGLRLPVRASCERPHTYARKLSGFAPQRTDTRGALGTLPCTNRPSQRLHRRRIEGARKTTRRARVARSVDEEARLHAPIDLDHGGKLRRVAACGRKRREAANRTKVVEQPPDFLPTLGDEAVAKRVSVVAFEGLEGRRESRQVADGECDIRGKARQPAERMWIAHV